MRVWRGSNWLSYSSFLEFNSSSLLLFGISTFFMKPSEVSFVKHLTPRQGWASAFSSVPMYLTLIWFCFGISFYLDIIFRFFSFTLAFLATWRTVLWGSASDLRLREYLKHYFWLQLIFYILLTPRTGYKTCPYPLCKRGSQWLWWYFLSFSFRFLPWSPLS